ncbi:hypothetical protein TNCV_2592111 [Trichonephila clavipes]|nr:hypothetical protein TNCV_2592111 [Trichonephila clavipes]
MIRIQEDTIVDEWLNEVLLKDSWEFKAAICFARISGQVRYSTHYPNEFPGVNSFQPEKEVGLENYVYLYTYLGMVFGNPPKGYRIVFEMRFSLRKKSISGNCHRKVIYFRADIIISFMYW